MSDTMTLLGAEPSAPFLSPVQADRLDVIAQEIRVTWLRIRRDVETTRRLLNEARDLCRARGQSFDKWCRSGKFGIKKAQVYRLLDGKTHGRYVSLGDVLHKEESPYQVTPPELKDRLFREFRLTDADDVCPHPRPANYDGLTVVWGTRSFCNPPWGEAYRWCQKAIAENAKGKLVVMVLPFYHHKAIAMLDVAGAEIRYGGLVDFLSLEDGKRGSKRPVDRNIIAICILRPRLAGDQTAGPHPFQKDDLNFLAEDQPVVLTGGPVAEVEPEDEEDDQLITRWGNELATKIWVRSRQKYRNHVSQVGSTP